MNPLSPTENYEVPKTPSRYLRFEKNAATKFLPLDSAISGHEYWNTENKPIRSKERPENPRDLRLNNDGTPSAIKHFWAFPVIDCATGEVKVLEITQKNVQQSIREYVANPEWGDPVLNYTFTVTRKGEGFETKYTTMANPAKEIPAEWLAAWEEAKKAGFDITRLFQGGDPFSGGEVASDDIL